MLCSTSFLCGQPCVIYAFRFCRCVSSDIDVCMSSTDVLTDMFTEVLIVLKFVLIPAISWSFIFCMAVVDNQVVIIG